MVHATRRVTLIAAIVLVAFAVEVEAAKFCVTTKIYEGASLDAAAEHRILFDEGLIYDLPQINSRVVTVYDPAQKRITLLDRQTQVQTTLRTDDLLDITAKARAAARTDDQQTRLGLKSTVQRSNRVIGYTIRFADFEYHTTTQKPDDPSMAIDYGQFAILASQLNLVRRIGPPPFARMTLSQHVTSRGELPLEKTLTFQRGKTSWEYRSTHTVDEMTEADREKIEEVRGMLVLYRAVNLKEFP